MMQQLHCALFQKFDTSCSVLVFVKCTIVIFCIKNIHSVLWFMFWVKLRDKLSSMEMKQQLWMEDIVKVVQWSRLQWYGRAMRKDDGDLVKNCYFGGWGSQTKRWAQGNMEGGCAQGYGWFAHTVNQSDAVDCSKWGKMIMRELE